MNFFYGLNEKNWEKRKAKTIFFLPFRAEARDVKLKSLTSKEKNEIAEEVGRDESLAAWHTCFLIDWQQLWRKMFFY